jgi:hypothetical protein
MYKLKGKLDRLLFSTVRIETDKSVGTGFIAIIDGHEKSKYIYFIVTNKHVIKDGNFLRLKFHALEAFDTENKTIDLTQHEEITHIGDLREISFPHPNDDIDIAIIPLNSLFKGKLPLFIPVLLNEHTPSVADNDFLGSVEQVFFSGYPSGLVDNINLLPIVRRGITATPYHVDFQGKPVFLLDGSVFPGSSGSPVFVADNNKALLDLDGTGLKFQSLTKERFYLLGILASVYTRNENYDVKVIEIPTSTQKIIASGQQMIDVGVVYKSSEILKLARFFLFERVLSPILKHTGESSNYTIDDNEIEMLLKKYAVI